MRRILHHVTRWIKGTSCPSDKPALIYVVAPAKGGSHDIVPGDQVAILRRVSSVSEKEGFPVTVLFVGRPNRKVPDGSKQDAVTVRYAMPDQLVKAAEHGIQEARKSHHPVLVSDHPELEKLARRRQIRHLRTATFEKALDSISGPIKKESREPRPERKPQSEQPQNRPATEPAAATEPAPAAAKPVEPTPKATQTYDPPVPKKETDAAILDLIDPL